MRRLIVLALLLAFAAPASAQTLGQGSALAKFQTGVTIANTTTATAIFSTLIPVSTFQNFTQTQSGATSIHVRYLGKITTNPSASSVGNVNLGCNYGGSTATISLANGLLITQNLSASPIILDLWLRASFTASNTPAPNLTGLLRIPGASVTSVNGGVTSMGPFQVAATVDGTTSITAAQTLTCTWQWASAAATNAVVWQTGLAVVGD